MDSFILSLAKHHASAIYRKNRFPIALWLSGRVEFETQFLDELDPRNLNSLTPFAQLDDIELPLARLAFVDVGGRFLQSPCYFALAQASRFPRATQKAQKGSVGRRMNGLRDENSPKTGCYNLPPSVPESGSLGI